MKQILLIILLVISKGLYAQNKVALYFKDCKTGNPVELEDVTLYLNDSIIKKYTFLNSDFIYEELAKGNYKIVYKSCFGTSEPIYFDVKQNAYHQDINICFTMTPKLDHLGQFVENLQNDEHLSVYSDDWGCFHSDKECLFIKKENNIFYFYYKNKKHKLNSGQLLALKQFEGELRNVVEASFASTGNNYIRMVYNGQHLSFLNPAGYWMGYENLKKVFNINQ